MAGGSAVRELSLFELTSILAPISPIATVIVPISAPKAAVYMDISAMVPIVAAIAIAPAPPVPTTKADNTAAPIARPPKMSAL